MQAQFQNLAGQPVMPEMYFDKSHPLRYTISMPLNRGIDAIIQEAIERGEFDKLPGAGKPLDLTAYFNTPEEVRLAYSILKSADVLPEEASLLKEVAALKEELDTCLDDGRCRKLRKAIDDRLLKYNLMMDRKKAR